MFYCNIAMSGMEHHNTAPMQKVNLHIKVELQGKNTISNWKCGGSFDSNSNSRSLGLISLQSQKCHFERPMSFIVCYVIFQLKAKEP